MKNAWDSFHRQAFRQTFIHGRLALTHLVTAAVLLEDEDPGDDPLDLFLSRLGGSIPLNKAGNFHLVLDPQELKPLGPVGRKNLGESVEDWFITKRITRPRAFEYLNLAQETVNLTISLIQERHPGFFDSVKR